jgi:drug/metabolite transporter (DMT)-like permease
MYKWLGIVVGFAGCLLLFTGRASSHGGSIGFGLLAVLATVCYGLNVNMVRQRLLQVPSLDIATLAFSFLILPSAGVLYATGFFHLPLSDPGLLRATAAASTLGVLGTALASVLFYILVKRAGIVFASLVTYGIPFVALGWGLAYGEKVNLLQMLALLVILAGVYLANQNFLRLLPWPKKKHPAKP